MASAGGDKVVRLWEPASGTQTSQLHGMQDMVTDLAFTCDQNHLVAAGTDKTLRMWDLSTARVKHTLTGHTDKVWCPPRARLLLCAKIYCLGSAASYSAEQECKGLAGVCCLWFRNVLTTWAHLSR